MSGYVKAFVVASLIYLLLGGVLGLAMGLGSAKAVLYFTHVHFNLLGFMAMMVFGVGYFILPRFNARLLKWPRMVAWHFYLANLGLWGMSFFNILEQVRGDAYPHGFAFFAALELISLVLFVVNMMGTLLAGAPAVAPRSGQASEPASAARAAGKGGGEPLAAATGPAQPASPVRPLAGATGTPEPITAETKVGEVLERYPESRELFVRAGIKALANPAHAEQVKKMPVTVGAACSRHGVDLEGLLAQLNELARASARRSVGTPGAAASPASLTPGAVSGAGQGAAIRDGDGWGGPVDPSMTIGDVVARYPATREVFLRYFGAGCFDCPGQAMESVAQGALMHDMSVEELVRELNRAVAQTPRSS